MCPAPGGPSADHTLRLYNLTFCFCIKHIKRTGWVLRNVKDCETVAGHMYRMSIMTFLLEGNQDGLDRSKCLELGKEMNVTDFISWFKDKNFSPSSWFGWEFGRWHHTLLRHYQGRQERTRDGCHARARKTYRAKRRTFAEVIYRKWSNLFYHPLPWFNFGSSIVYRDCFPWRQYWFALYVYCIVCKHYTFWHHCSDLGSISGAIRS